MGVMSRNEAWSFLVKPTRPNKQKEGFKLGPLYELHVSYPKIFPPIFHFYLTFGLRFRLYIHDIIVHSFAFGNSKSYIQGPGSHKAWKGGRVFELGFIVMAILVLELFILQVFIMEHRGNPNSLVLDSVHGTLIVIPWFREMLVEP